MQRGSSVNFQPVKSAGHAVSHASREVQPQYLLPPDKTMGTIVLLDDKGTVASTLEAKMALASRQAKRQGDYTPLWEGVINLRSPEPGEDATLYKNECSTAISNWCAEYEKTTGHKVLRADIHLDEGRLDKETDEVIFNAHAHVICDKTNDLGRVIKLNAPALRKVQDFTANITQLERGESSFKTGRKHIGHQQYKALAEKGRLETQQVKDKLNKSKRDLDRTRQLSKEWSDQDRAVVQDLQEKLDGEPARLDAALKAQEAKLNEQYRLDREAMKASGTAKQFDYQALKKDHEAELAKLKADAMAVITPLRNEVKTMKIQIQLKDEYTRELEAKVVAGEAKLAAELVAKAETIEAQVQSGEKSPAVLKTAIDHRAAASKLMTPAPLIVPGQGSAHPPAPSTRGGETAMPTKEGVKALRERLQEATKTAAQPLFSPGLGNPTIAPTKSLKTRLSESWDAFVDWIKRAGGRQEEVTASSRHDGPVVQLDDLHAVQRTGKSQFAIHQLDRLDQVPQLNDPKMIIQYRDGVGQVTEGPTHHHQMR